MESKNIPRKTDKKPQPAVAGESVTARALSVAKSRKHVLINQLRLKKAQELLGAKTESETIERALQRVITEAETDREVWAAHERFVKGLVKENVEILDVFGRLDA